LGENSDAIIFAYVLLLETLVDELLLPTLVSFTTPSVSFVSATSVACTLPDCR
jgi:hypothetical protein